MHRTLVLSLQELWHDHVAVAERVNHACRGTGGAFRVRGIAQFKDRVFVYLLPVVDDVTEAYVLAPWEDESVAGVSTCLSERWGAGFDLVGAIQLDEGHYLLLLAQGEPLRA
jgi:hypothetical protein